MVGSVTDRRPQPYSLAFGWSDPRRTRRTVAGAELGLLLVSVSLVGLGSSIFHPESSRIANMAAGERRGLAQSVSRSEGMPVRRWALLAAAIVSIRGRSSVMWFTPLALAAILVLSGVGRWYAGRVAARGRSSVPRRMESRPGLSQVGSPQRLSFCSSSSSRSISTLQA